MEVGEEGEYILIATHTVITRNDDLHQLPAAAASRPVITVLADWA